MKAIISLVLTSYLLATILARPSYIAHVSISGNPGSKDNIGVHKMEFTMDKSKVKYGQIYGVPIYIMKLKHCNVQIMDNQYPDWFSAYVEVPSHCSDRSITKNLEANGADFIFLTHEHQDTPKPMLLPHNIEVPVFELDAGKHAQFIKEVEAGGDGTTLTISMPYPKAEHGKVRLELFYTTTNVRSFKYIEEIGKVVSTEQKFNFEPYIVLYANSRNPKSKNCIGSGKYCAPDPDNSGVGTGADVVMEMLRQKCVYKLNSSQWYLYMEAWKSACFKDITNKCSNKALAATTIKPAQIETCIKESNIEKEGLKESNLENKLLENEMQKLRKTHEMTFPALYINGQRFEGHVNKNEILIRICDTFDVKPQVCSEVELEYNGQHVSLVWSILIYMYILLIGLVIIAFACIGLAKRAARREVNYEVKKSVANYFALKESEDLK